MKQSVCTLIDFSGLPKFDQIAVKDIEPTLDLIIGESRLAIEKLLSNSKPKTWENFVAPLNEIDNRLSRTFSPVSHLNAVQDSDELRQAYEACLPKLTAYTTDISQNINLFNAFNEIKNSGQYAEMNQSQKQVVDHAVRDFKLSGVDLPELKKTRYKQIQQLLSKKCNAFSQNVLDSTHGWSLLITDKNQLSGVPESVCAIAKQIAQKNHEAGWRFTLDAPLYVPFMTYSDIGEYREKMYRAFTTRASDQYPASDKWDNSQLMVDIINLRQECAGLLGFANYAEYSVATKMATSVEQVVNFLINLANKAKPYSEDELSELRSFAKEEYGANNLNAWDISYFSEKLKQKRYAFSQEDVKPYFPVESVLKGMFDVVNKLFDVTVKQRDNPHLWHEDVRFFEISDHDHIIGHFYIDLFAREHKRGGAWMADCVGRMRGEQGLQKPAAFLTCNFSPPVDNEPSLLTHDEVVTLFHEFGHGLHHLLTEIDEPAVAGINGVAWDAVELPSQFLENWCWEPQGLELISSHYQSGEKLPDELYKKMRDARNFQCAMLMLRQIEFSLFDILLHQELAVDSPAMIGVVLDQARDQVAVINPPEFNRFQNSFSHIFAGGYAAGYYSYKWAEVLSADAFSKFEEDGVFNPDTGKAFRRSILANGGSREPMELFIEFRGREPQVDALLRHNGLTEKAA